MREENVELLRKNGVIVYLRTGVSTLVKRLLGDEDRPLLKGEDGLEKRLISLLEVRTPIYERVASYVVDTDGKTPQELALEILGHVRDKK